MPNDVTLNPAGGIPSITLRFGFTQFAKFRVFLWDQNGQNPQQIVHGSNLPGAPETFSLGVSASNLIGHFLTWDALIVSTTGGQGQQYSMTANFSQDNNPLPNTTFVRSGPLNGAAVDMDQAKFV